MCSSWKPTLPTQFLLEKAAETLLYSYCPLFEQPKLFQARGPPTSGVPDRFNYWRHPLWLLWAKPRELRGAPRQRTALSADTNPTDIPAPTSSTRSSY